MYSRREFGKLALAALALPHAARAAAQEIGGVHLGVQTYSFREMTRGAADPIAVMAEAMKTAGFTECELWAGALEPREGAKNWRLQTPLDQFAAMKKKFGDAGIKVHAYNYSFRRDMSDEEIDRGFQMAKALGAEFITASTTVDTAKRVVPFAEKHKMVVAMHNHSNLEDPNEFATPESFAKAMAMSKYFKVNLDVGHYVAANFDPLAYLKEHHASVTNLHLKDRKKNQGDNVPWGAGDAPIKEVLQLVKNQRWPIRAYVEYEYKGSGTPVEETRKCLEYAKSALA